MYYGNIVCFFYTYHDDTNVLLLLVLYPHHDNTMFLDM